jgi:hypothetical protein
MDLSSLYTCLQERHRVDKGLVLRLGPEPHSVDANFFFTPRNHDPANVIGVELVKHLGLVIEGDEWRWMKHLPYW